MRPRRDIEAPSSESSSACPWKWKLSKTRLHHLPSKIVKAVCPRCAHYCRPIYYQIKVLVRDGCDPVSGLSLWRWRERRIVVAYVMKTWKCSQPTCSYPQLFPSERRQMGKSPPHAGKALGIRLTARILNRSQILKLLWDPKVEASLPFRLHWERHLTACDHDFGRGEASLRSYNCSCNENAPFKIELRVRLSALWLFLVDHVVRMGELSWLARMVFL